MSYNRVGICSICRGDVVVPQDWMATVPPVPTCQRCGAIAARYQVPVLPMIQKQRFYPSGTHKQVIAYGL